MFWRMMRTQRERRSSKDWKVDRVGMWPQSVSVKTKGSALSLDLTLMKIHLIL
jgi:hypothetical protein